MLVSMNTASEWTTVYRSMDDGAEDQAGQVTAMLLGAGIQAVMLNDEAPGVVEGTYEVRVGAQDAARAEELIASAPAVTEDLVEDVDPSHELDMVPVYTGEGMTAEMEAIGVQSVLAAGDIQAVMVGSSTLPNLRFEVHVPLADAERAQALLWEAEAEGPAAAEEAERGTEGVLPPAE